MKEALLVFFGGGMGSVVRFSLGRWIDQMHNRSFPFGTLAVNIVACFALGAVIGLADHRQLLSPSTRLFWTVGFCGGFSTFSTFSNETLSLMQGGFTMSAFLYVASSLGLCVATTFAGIYAGEHIG